MPADTYSAEVTAQPQQLQWDDPNNSYNPNNLKAGYVRDGSGGWVNPSDPRIVPNTPGYDDKLRDVWNSADSKKRDYQLLYDAAQALNIPVTEIRSALGWTNPDGQKVGGYLYNQDAWFGK
jgi:predicted phosphoadenosine phosphosulfate sulfurtransferase